MIPYGELAEDVKEYDRVTVRRVLDALCIRYESKPRFSEEEVAAAKHIESRYPEAELVRKESGYLYLRSSGSNVGPLLLNLFPGLRLGQSIALKEIVGEKSLG